MVCICAIVRRICGAYLYTGEDRHRRRQFQSGNGDQNRGRRGDGLGDGVSDECARRHFGDRQEKLGVPDSVRPGDRCVMAMLLQGLANRRSVKGGARR